MYLNNLGYHGSIPSSSTHADRLIKKGPRKRYC